MDAVKLWRVVRALVLARPVLAGALTLFYVAAALLLHTLHGRNALVAPLVLVAFPTAGFFGMASERIVRYSLASAAVPLPGHAEAMRRGQAAMMVIFLGLPLLGTYLGGAPLSYGALLCVPAALGVLLSRYPSAILPLWVTFMAAEHFAPHFAPHLAPAPSSRQADWPIGAWLGSPWVRAALILASALALYRWLDLASITEQRARGLSLGLADAAHEGTGPGPRASRRAIPNALAARWQRYHLAVDRIVGDLSVHIRRAVISPATLALGLGFPSGTRWSVVFRVSGVAVLALIAGHLLVRPQTELLIYFAVSAMAAVQLLGRLELLLRAWRDHPDEAALLRLAPRWPPARRVKALFCLLQLQCLTGTWAAWGLLSVVVLAVDLVAARQVLIAATALAAASTAGCGGLWAALARRRIVADRLSWLSVLIGLCCAAGGALWLWGPGLWGLSAWIGAAAMLAAPALALAAFLLRPLQFPANRLHRASAR